MVFYKETKKELLTVLEIPSTMAQPNHFNFFTFWGGYSWCEAYT